MLVTSLLFYLVGYAFAGDIYQARHSGAWPFKLDLLVMVHKLLHLIVMEAETNVVLYIQSRMDILLSPPTIVRNACLFIVRNWRILHPSYNGHVMGDPINNGSWYRKTMGE
jgi:hypothetical protein